MGRANALHLLMGGVTKSSYIGRGYGRWPVCNEPQIVKYTIVEFSKSILYFISKKKKQSERSVEISLEKTI